MTAKKRASSISPEAKTARNFRVVCLSDTHGLHREVQIPDGDVLIHAGDMTNFFQPLERSWEELKSFNDWLEQIPHRHKIVVAGNHDLVFQEEPKKAKTLLSNAHYLENSGIELEGIHFWGSPTTPVMASMAFAATSRARSRETWNRIPDDTDVLITHGPPYGTLDKNDILGRHHGCQYLTGALLRVRPRLHVFGHIHGGYGYERAWERTLLVNCAIVNSRREIAHPPIVVDLTL
jgi:Icc-related predicted phosphoesterase